MAREVLYIYVEFVWSFRPEQEHRRLVNEELVQRKRGEGRLCLVEVRES